MNKKLEIATLAGGCFWCTEALFTRLKGVISVLPGYAGGNIENPTYQQVCSGSTGHAEAIQVEFDPLQISFTTILDIFMNTHNPTTLNQQGHDIGTQYRSAIFYQDEEQKEIAEKVIAKLEKEKIFQDQIVTKISPFTNFYEAENYHENYFENHKDEAYCDITITPKIHKLLEKYNQNIKEEYKK